MPEERFTPVGDDDGGTDGDADPDPTPDSADPDPTPDPTPSGSTPTPRRRQLERREGADTPPADPDPSAQPADDPDPDLDPERPSSSPPATGTPGAGAARRVIEQGGRDPTPQPPRTGGGTGPTPQPPGSPPTASTPTTQGGTPAPPDPADEGVERRPQVREETDTTVDTPEERAVQEFTGRNPEFGPSEVETERVQTDDGEVVRARPTQDALSERATTAFVEDNPEFSRSDVVVEETADGVRAQPSDPALKREVREQVASRSDAIDPSDVVVERTADGVQASLRNEAVERLAERQAAEQVEQTARELADNPLVAGAADEIVDAGTAVGERADVTVADEEAVVERAQRTVASSPVGGQQAQAVAADTVREFAENDRVVTVGVEREQPEQRFEAEPVDPDNLERDRGRFQESVATDDDPRRTGEPPGIIDSFAATAANRRDLGDDFIGEDVERFLNEEKRKFSGFAERTGQQAERLVPTVLDVPAEGTATVAEAAGQSGLAREIRRTESEFTASTVQGGLEAVNPAGLASAGVETAEAGAFVLGGVGRGTAGVEGVARRSAAVAGEGVRLGAGLVASGARRPASTAGVLTGSAVTGVGVGRGIERTATTVRGVRAARDGGVVEFERVSPEAARTGDEPTFRTSPSAPAEVAAAEVRRRSAAATPTTVRRQLGGERTLFRSETDAFRGEFEAGAGRYEIEGLFASPELSPLRFQGRSSSASFAPRLPRVRQGESATALEGPEVRTLPAGSRADPVYPRADPEGRRVRGSASRFMREDADEGVAYVRAADDRTSELEAIYPPGSRFEEVGQFAIRKDDRLIPARTFRAVDDPGSGEAGALRVPGVGSRSTITRSELPRTRIRDPEGQPVAGRPPTSAGSRATSTTATTTSPVRTRAASTTLGTGLSSGTTAGLTATATSTGATATSVGSATTASSGTTSTTGSATATSTTGPTSSPTSAASSAGSRSTGVSFGTSAAVGSGGSAGTSIGFGSSPSIGFGGSSGIGGGRGVRFRDDEDDDRRRREQADDDRGISITGQDFLAPGWLSETVTRIATRGRGGTAPSQAALEAAVGPSSLVGENPTAEMLTGDDQTQERIADVQGLLGITSGPSDEDPLGVDLGGDQQ